MSYYELCTVHGLLLTAVSLEKSDANRGENYAFTGANTLDYQGRLSIKRTAKHFDRPDCWGRRERWPFDSSEPQQLDSGSSSEY